MQAANMDKTITIYCRKPLGNGKEKSIRRVLKNCSLEEKDSTTAKQTGNVINELSSIRIPCDSSGLEYISPQEWYALKEGIKNVYWTCDLELPAKPLIVPFECLQEFDVGTSGEVTRAENAFIEQNPGALRIVDRKDNRKPNGSHIRLWT